MKNIISMKPYWLSVTDAYYNHTNLHPLFTIWEWLRSDYGCRMKRPIGHGADISPSDYDLVFDNENDLLAFRIRFQKQ